MSIPPESFAEIAAVVDALVEREQVRIRSVFRDGDYPSRVVLDLGDLSTWRGRIKDAVQRAERPPLFGLDRVGQPTFNFERLCQQIRLDAMRGV